MKKSISILSVFLLLSSYACRSGNDEFRITEFQNPEPASSSYFQRDSIPNDQSTDGKDDEPPRKDLQQWKPIP